MTDEKMTFQQVADTYAAAVKERKVPHRKEQEDRELQAATLQALAPNLDRGNTDIIYAALVTAWMRIVAPKTFNASK